MKKATSEVRNKRVIMRLNPAEFDKLNTLYKKSACRQLSDYLRKVVLQKPVTIKYRNESADEILSGLLKLKNELNAIGNNFNQAVHKLHTLHFVPEVRSWIISNENCAHTITKKMDEIISWMTQIYQQWSQK